MSSPYYEERIAALRAGMAQHGCDAFFSVDPKDNAYLTGFFGSTSALIVSEHVARLLCDFRYIEQAQEQAQGVEVVECTGSLDLRLAEHIAGLNIRQAAFEPDVLSVARFDALRGHCNATLTATPGLCRELRICKDPGEQAKIAAATALAEDAFEAALKHITPGVSEAAIAGQIDYEFRKRGAQGASFDTTVLFGAHSSLPHGKPGNRTLQDGDIVLVDWGCVLDGYCSDLTRTLVFGRIPGGWFEEIYEITRIAQETALRAAQPGAAAQDVDAAARMIIAAAGYGERFGHGLGHGVGLEVHEAPRLNTESRAILAPGMAVTVEPGIYLPGKGGVRIEDLIVITEAGCTVLPRLSKELRIL